MTIQNQLDECVALHEATKGLTALQAHEYMLAYSKANIQLVQESIDDSTFETFDGLKKFLGALENHRYAGNELCAYISLMAAWVRIHHQPDPLVFYHAAHDAGLISTEFLNLFVENFQMFHSVIKPERHYLIDHLGAHVAVKPYLIKVDGMVEDIQWMFYRVDLAVSGNVNGYGSLSKLEYIPGTPTLSNAGTRLGQLASCFTISQRDFSDALYSAALISRQGGGVGLDLSFFRSTSLGVLHGPAVKSCVLDYEEQPVSNFEAKMENECIWADDYFLAFATDKRIEYVLSEVADTPPEHGPFFETSDTTFKTDCMYRCSVLIAKTFSTPLVEEFITFQLNNMQNMLTVLRVAQSYDLQSVFYEEIGEYNYASNELVSWAKKYHKQLCSKEEFIEQLKIGKHDVVKAYMMPVSFTMGHVEFFGKLYLANPRPEKINVLVPRMDCFRQKKFVADLPDALPHRLSIANSVVGFFDQGGNNRKAAIAFYMEVWHMDIFDFLNAKKTSGVNSGYGFDLFYALWVCDEFMRRVEKDEMWTLMPPKYYIKLHTLFGKEFDDYYRELESKGEGTRIRATVLFNHITSTLLETGSPYILFKDQINRTNNQKHVGPVFLSNLCSEIVESTTEADVSTCNLANVNLAAFCKSVASRITVQRFPDVDPMEDFDFDGLVSTVKNIVQRLNITIDATKYPIMETRQLNDTQRPLGIGVQGLANVFHTYCLSYDDDKARELHDKIFETIYYSALEHSNKMTDTLEPFTGWENSFIGQGTFNFELHGGQSKYYADEFEALRARIKQRGAANSLLIALMPTQTTSQFLNNSESFEPHKSNFYIRGTAHNASIQIFNKYLVHELSRLNMWNGETIKQIIRDDGSIQMLSSLDHAKELQKLKLEFKTIYEYSQRTLIDYAIRRAPFVDQSQSMNLYFRKKDNVASVLSSCLFYGWRHGLKTGIYYCRTTNHARGQIMEPRLNCSQCAM